MGGFMEINDNLWFGSGYIEECRKTVLGNEEKTIYKLKIQHLNGFVGFYLYEGSSNFPLEEGKLVVFQFKAEELLQKERMLINIELS